MYKVLGVATAALMVAASTQAAVILMDATTNGGGFELPASANAESTADWTFQYGTGTYGQGLTSGTFVALGRGNAPSTGVHGGTLCGVINAGTRGVFDSNAITASINTGDSFDFSAFFASNGAGTAGPASYYAELFFSDGSTGLLTSESALTGANTGRVTGPTTPDPTDWSQVNHSFTYTGTGATDVVLRVQITGNGNQAYFDDFSLTQTVAVPEPATLGLLGLAFGGLVMLRRRRK